MVDKISSFLNQIGTSEPIFSGIVALLALVSFIIWPVRWAWKWLRPPAPPKFILANPEELRPATPNSLPPNTVQMDLEAYFALQAKSRDEARADLAKAHGAERQRLEDKIEELTRRYADPEAAFAQFQSRITYLETQLTRSANDLGGDRANDAKAALELGDFTLAKTLFEEINTRKLSDVMVSAEASFALGQIAEAEIRWHDAAAHYAQAARLNPTFGTLQKANEYAQRSGSFASALSFSSALVSLTEMSEDPSDRKSALNDHASNLQKLGFLNEAESLLRQALGIEVPLDGRIHVGDVIVTNNLGSVVRALGRLAEAETLFCQSLELCEKTVGKSHPYYATRLANLAGVYEAQGRYPEAEGLYRQALAIGAETIGLSHPAYAKRLRNLSNVVLAQGRSSEAEALCLQAMEIDRSTIGTSHPDYSVDLNNLGRAVQEQGRFAEAERHFSQAMEIESKSLGETGANYAIYLGNLACVVHDQGRFPEAEGMFRKATAILRDRLGDAHYNTRKVAMNFLTLLETNNPTAPDVPALRTLLAKPLS